MFKALSAISSWSEKLWCLYFWAKSYQQSSFWSAVKTAVCFYLSNNFSFICRSGWKTLTEHLRWVRTNPRAQCFPVPCLKLWQLPRLSCGNKLLRVALKYSLVTEYSSTAWKMQSAVKREGGETRSPRRAERNLKDLSRLSGSTGSVSPVTGAAAPGHRERRSHAGGNPLRC